MHQIWPILEMLMVYLYLLTVLGPLTEMPKAEMDKEKKKHPNFYTQYADNKGQGTKAVLTIPSACNVPFKELCNWPLRSISSKTLPKSLPIIVKVQPKLDLPKAMT